MLGFAPFEHLRLRLGRARRAFARDAGGNFAMMFALAAPILILFVGMGVDYKVGLSDKARLDTSADAAALAAVNSAKAYSRPIRAPRAEPRCRTAPSPRESPRA